MPKYSLTKKQRKTEQEQGKQTEPPSSTCVHQHTNPKPIPGSKPFPNRTRAIITAASDRQGCPKRESTEEMLTTSKDWKAVSNDSSAAST